MRVAGKRAPNRPIGPKATHVSGVAHVSGVSGQRARALPPEPRSVGFDDFREPDLELVSLVERVGSRVSDGDELAEARALLAERALVIGSLNERVLALESMLAELTDTLRARERELTELARVAAPQPPDSAQTAREAPPLSLHPEVSAPPAREASPPSLYPEMTALPVLQRVSIALRDSMSVPPPSRPDAVPPSRRREPRRSCELELEFTDETHFFAGLTQDLSQGGVFIATYHVFPVGSRLELGFQLPGGTEVRARGVVRWVREAGEPGQERPGMGVAFSELSESALNAIASYCERRAPLYMEL